ncbi:MAG: haloacid dehalogenase [Anaerolineales bacterium]
MHNLDHVSEQIRKAFEARNTARDKALAQARLLTRACALAIRAVHREDEAAMQAHLAEARDLVAALRRELADFPDLYYAGYTQDALKEYAEASITCALIRRQPLPSLDDLDLPPATYLNGLAEAIGELRRRCLDILRHGYSTEVEHLLGHMDDIFSVLVTMDFPDAITNGLRRQTDVARSLIERTRGDITFSLRGEHLERSIQRLSAQLSGATPPDSPRPRPSPEEE